MMQTESRTNIGSLQHEAQTDDHELSWYALRVFHNKSSVICAQADKDGVEWYTPIREEEYFDKEGIHIRHLHLMPSLLFLHCTKEYIERIEQLTYGNIRPYCEPGSRVPQAIDEKQMQMFIFVARTAIREAEIVDYEPKRGERVRITGGIFNGAIGEIRRIHGTRRFVVSVEGVTAIATSYIPRQYIEPIE